MTIHCKNCSINFILMKCKLYAKLSSIEGINLINSVEIILGLNKV